MIENKPSVHYINYLDLDKILNAQNPLSGEGKEPFKLSPGDAFVIPPKMKTQYTMFSEDLELLEVSLPGKFKTYY